MQKMQRTLGIMKPDLVSRKLEKKALNDIESHFKNLDGFKILSTKMMTLTKEQAREFYAEHREKGFFEQMVNFMTKGPVLLFVMEGENIITNYRDLIGATDPKKSDIGTLRHSYGISIDENSFHGSDAYLSALREISFFNNLNI